MVASFDRYRPGITLSSLADQDPYPTYASLRENHPICQLEPDGVWAVSRYEDVCSALRQPKSFSSTGVKALLAPDWLCRECKRDLFILTMDPPEHRRYRSLLENAFSKRAVESLEQFLREAIQRQLNAISTDERVDFLTRVAFPYIRDVMDHVLGIKGYDNIEELHRWLRLVGRISVTRPDDDYIHELEDAIHAQYSRLDSVIRERRDNPTDDLTSDLVNAEVGGRRLSDHSLRNLLDLLIEAGFHTSLQMLCLAVLHLSRHPHVLDALNADHDLIPDYIEELLRYSSTAPAVLRKAKEKVSLSDVDIPKGATVLLLLAAANRDPGVFENPDEFIIGRKNIKRHIAFGYGPHVCIGAALARLEIKVALEAIVDAFDEISCPPDRDLAWSHSPMVRGIEELPAVFSRNKGRPGNGSKLLAATVSGVLLTVNVITTPDAAQAQATQPSILDKVIVTAEKREKSLQNAPNAISVLNDVQLETLGISSLDRLADGIIPSLRIEPNGTSPSSLVIAIRGNGATDPGQVTRESSVAVYLDGFYLSRTQGLSMELADLDRIEVLRGPQGTLFGRNATGGAVNMISRKPSGEFGIRQTVGYGRFDEIRSVTRVDLPEFSGFRLKLDYIHHQRDGWVDNTAADQSDFNAFNRDALRISLNWQPTDTLELDYGFNYADTSETFFYHQLLVDNIGIIGVEPGRQRQTRFPIVPLEPIVTEHMMHTLTATWRLSDSLTIKSLTSYRELEEELNNNFTGVLYFNGLVVDKDFDQDQWTQEVQLLGTSQRLEWVAGFYYFDEDASDSSQDLFSLDVFGLLTGTPLTPIMPPTTFNVFAGADVPLRTVEANAKSVAVYGHATWTPPIFDDRLHIGIGLRYTNDDRSGTRDQLGVTAFDLSTDHVDPSVTISYDLADTVLAYAKYSTGYRAGGVSPRSTTFTPYQEDEAETFEIGVKSEFWGSRVRLNAAAFTTNYDGLQIDFSDPDNLIIVETINAANTVEIDGVEIELTVIPVPGLVLGFNYTYLDGDIPLQPNPLADGELTQFALVQTPEHAGSLTLDYTFEPWSFGTLTAHLDVTATDEYAYVAFAPRSQVLDSYALVNARLTLADIPVGNDTSRLSLSVWARNLGDAEYIIFGFPVGVLPIALTQVFGAPRTFGFDATLQF